MPFTGRAPSVVQEKAGTKYICACGNSKNKPYCDGSHQGTGIQPFKVELAADKTCAWCACGTSQNRPWCDGSHAKLKA